MISFSRTSRVAADNAADDNTSIQTNALDVYCVVCEASQGVSCQIRPFGIECEPHNARRRDASIAAGFSTAARLRMAVTVPVVENRHAPEDVDAIRSPGRPVQLDCNA